MKEEAYKKPSESSMMMDYRGSYQKCVAANKMPFNNNTSSYYSVNYGGGRGMSPRRRNSMGNRIKRFDVTIWIGICKSYRLGRMSGKGHLCEYKSRRDIEYGDNGHGLVLLTNNMLIPIEIAIMETHL